ncbi:CDF family Co(II)/Ni(II) efflux transporter DmeF [Candidatus Rariloculus sp.]|uniref:CDF family Co(II)/Ni(II) efflux transporter DmeF n=1 Tax=Candidatus Rariloculus sp. TaxID=3101265 RepID=UPI003D0F7022
MHENQLKRWQHSHTFGQDLRRPGETKTLIVIAITGLMMVIEIVAGIVYGSMALLADGLHMASHAAALSINAFAYVYARRHANDARFSFGTGKVNVLGGFTGAVLLAGFALAMAMESIGRFISPVPIAFNQAIIVAIVGLIVNGVSVLILEQKAPKGHGEDGAHHDHGHDHGHGHGHHRHGHHHHDHNLVSAYLHVLADALTSLLAIFALLGAKYFGFVWMDPAMGIVGAILVARWSIGLLGSTSSILLDGTAPKAVSESVRESIEAADDNRVADLHVWAVGPGIYSAIVSVVTHEPKPADYYKKLLPSDKGIVHVSVEVHRCKD